MQKQALNLPKLVAMHGFHALFMFCYLYDIKFIASCKVVFFWWLERVMLWEYPAFQRQDQMVVWTTERMT